MPNYHPNPWTPEQLAILHRDLVEHGPTHVAAQIGRTPGSVSSKAVKLGLRGAQSACVWTEDEVNFLRENCRTMPLTDLAKHLKKGYQNVTYKLRCLGLRKGNGDIIGRRFEALTVLAPSSRRSYYTCRCVCGTEKDIFLGNLYKMKSCGCLTNKRAGFTGHGQIWGKLWGSIRRMAKERRLEFAITIEYAWNLFLGQTRKCALTGMDIAFASASGGNDGTASLDRIDSSRGYVKDNVQWVHKDVNELKWDKSVPRLIELCRMVVSHHDRENQHA